MPAPTLMLVTDSRTAGGDERLLARVSASVAGGVNIVQVRAKDRSAMEQVALAIRIREAIDKRAMLLVNGSPEVAEAADANGVHLPEAAEMPEDVGGLIVGRSVHSVNAAHQAQEDCCDYVIAGPVFETPTHPGVRGAGVTLIAEIAAAVTVPVIAIGGITAANLPDVIAAGASGVAVISAVLGADDAEAAASALWDALSRSQTVTAS